jgi:phytoene dehydrogenase-like protein
MHDIVIIGGGHNGLTAAAYLAKAGLDVALFEAKEYVGGGVVTREVTRPGFRHDLYGIGHTLILDNPLIREDELGLLSHYGLRYVFPDPSVAVAFADGDYIAFYRDPERTAETIGRISPRDAENYLRLHAFATRLPMASGMFDPPPPLGRWIAQLDRNETGRELIRICLMSYLDVINEWFENQKVQAALVRYISEFMVAPEEGCTGALVVLMLSTIHRCGLGFPIGGSGVLSESLARALCDLGGTIRTGATVERILFDGDRATGVMLASGEQIEARQAVVADVSIRQIPGLVEHRFGEKWDHKVNRIKGSLFVELMGHVALSEAPIFRSGPEMGGAGLQEIAVPIDEMRRAFDDLKYGIPELRMPTISVPTIWDPARAPRGQHTLYLLSYAPEQLAEGDWDTRKEELFDRVFDAFCDLTVNMSQDKVLGRIIDSPLDIGRSNKSWGNGEGGHFGSQLFQLMSYRPLPGMGYRLPAENLYLVGPSTHPGGGVTGGARAGVQAIMKDLGLDFSSVI